MKLINSANLQKLAFLSILFIGFSASSQVVQVNVNMAPLDYLTLFKRDLFSKDFLNAAITAEGIGFQRSGPSPRPPGRP